ncbi:MAG: cyclase family protein [Ktedonobacteraceae bacterium]
MTEGKQTRLVDLSLPIRNASFDTQEQHIEYTDHYEMGRLRAKAYGVQPDELPMPGVHAAMERVTLSTHAGTHMDAPIHYGPTSEGKPAKTIDEIPLEWCYGDGVVLDFSWMEAGRLIKAGDVQEALKKINYQLKPLDIVLIRTDRWKDFDKVDWVMRHPGMGRESTLWLIEQGIRMMGTDGWGWDIPIPTMAEELKKGNKAAFFPGHYAGRDREYCHVEKMAHLDELPSHGFKVAIFPILIERASGGWCRPVAFVQD